ASRPIQASHVLKKMTPEDDVEAYLLAFERCAERGLAKGTMGWHCHPFSSGRRKAYFDLKPEAASDYIQLKAEILARAGVTTTVGVQCFHTWRFQEGKAPRSQMFGLIHLTRRWLQLDTNNPTQIIEILMMDRFLCELPPMVRKWVGQGNPANTQELIDLVEGQLTTGELARIPFVARVWNSGCLRVQRTGPPVVPTAKGLKSGSNNGGPERAEKNDQCYQCNELGRIIVHCPNEPEPMIANVVNSVEGTHQFMRPTKVNGKDTMALTDTGSAMTLISGTLIKPSELDHTWKTGITCIHGDINYYLTARVQVGVIPKLPHLVIVGQD
uniref:SCAN box domain-containing protein n=1 Tax=Latimeria chalumnae TaxID=7897 RepID=H3ARU9_LATCH